MPKYKDVTPEEAGKLYPLIDKLPDYVLNGWLRWMEGFSSPSMDQSSVARIVGNWEAHFEELRENG